MSKGDYIAIGNLAIIKNDGLRQIVYGKDDKLTIYDKDMFHDIVVKDRQLVKDIIKQIAEESDGKFISLGYVLIKRVNFIKIHRDLKRLVLFAYLLNEKSYDNGVPEPICTELYINGDDADLDEIMTGLKKQLSC